MKKILVTGAAGFVGKNLCARLAYSPDTEVTAYDIDSDPGLLDLACRDCSLVFDLAGVNRPEDPADFMKGNFGFAQTLLDTLEKHGNTCPVMISSSTQAALDNPYGQSKRAGEDLFFDYAKKTGSKVLVYRFPNIFGKWCRPNYNSAVATFCNNIANGLPITVNNRATELHLVYIDDVVDELLLAIDGKEHRHDDPAAEGYGFCYVPTVYTVTLGEIADLLHSFEKSRKDIVLPDVTQGSFSQRLWATFLTYYPPEDGFAYDLTMHGDARGSFTELLRSPDRGQFSVNISRPGITKGDHWHDTKFEKFIVVSGKACISFRKVTGEGGVYRYHVDASKGIRAVDIPPGYTHSIANEGDTGLVTFMWCSECYDPSRPDTFIMKVDE